MKEKKSSTLFLTQLALLAAVELIFAFTPLGSIPITVGIVATLFHLPVIVAGLMLGRKAALYLGTLAGLCSLYAYSTYLSGTPGAFAFSPFAPNGEWYSLLICLVPRMFFGWAARVLYDFLVKKWEKAPKIIFGGIAGMMGALIHTFLVLSGIYLGFSGHGAVGVSVVNFVIAWAGVNAILEAVTALLVGGAAVSRIGKRDDD
ncbi:MAG: ECF transporter S component [Clostridiales bacterium]|nr:ECF transporter S component [Clostridiales bacterium]